MRFRMIKAEKLQGYSRFGGLIMGSEESDPNDIEDDEQENKFL